MEKNKFLEFVPNGRVIKNEKLGENGAWLVEVELKEGSEYLDDAVSVEVIKRDPEVKPRMIAVLKTSSGCDSNECLAFELALKNDMDVVAFARSHFK